MRCTELDRSGGAIIRAITDFRRREAARTELHVSTIINDILVKLEPSRYARPTPNINRLSYHEIGNALEDVIAARLVRRLKLWDKPEPRLHRGIWGSPDGCDWRTPQTRTIDEIKVTWVSVKDFVVCDRRGQVVEESLKFMAYRMQSQFYAQAYRAARIRLHVLFVVGEYRVPLAKTYILRPTARELEDNYCILRQHAIDTKLDGYRELRRAA